MLQYKRLPLEGLVNARDLGGFPTRDGRITKYGVFIRSEVPAALTQKDIDFLMDYGVDMSVDLRGKGETDELPSSLSTLDRLSYYLCPTFETEASQASPSREEPHPPEDDGKSFWDIDWLPIYTGLIDSGKDWVRRVFELICFHEGCILYHCFTGKDRTGLLTALILGACGVEYTDIMWDYSLSMTCLRPFYMTMKTGILFTKEDGQPDFTRGFYRTSPETMEGVLAHIDAQYGGVEEYLKACGVSQEHIDALRRKLVCAP